MFNAIQSAYERASEKVCSAYTSCYSTSKLLSEKTANLYAKVQRVSRSIFDCFAPPNTKRRDCSICLYYLTKSTAIITVIFFSSTGFGQQMSRILLTEPPPAPLLYNAMIGCPPVIVGALPLIGRRPLWQKITLTAFASIASIASYGMIYTIGHEGVNLSKAHSWKHEDPNVVFWEPLLGTILFGLGAFSIAFPMSIVISCVACHTEGENRSAPSLDDRKNKRTERIRLMRPNQAVASYHLQMEEGRV